MPDAPTPEAVTFPFFIQQVGFHQADITRQAKYILFFVTKVIRLRRDGIGLPTIAQAISSVTGSTLTDDDLHRIKDFFANDPDIYLARRDGGEVYAILDARVQFLFAELNRHLRVFISYTRSFQDTAERIRNVLMRIGVAAWLDIHEPGYGTIMDNIRKAIDDSCLVVFLITPEFEYQGMTKHVIDRTLFHHLSRNRERFAIIPIVLLKPDETPSPRLIEERVPQPLRHANLACHWARDDAEIIEHIVDAMPVRLGITDWKRPQPLKAESNCVPTAALYHSITLISRVNEVKICQNF